MDHQPCILSIDLKLKKPVPPKFISYRKAVDDADSKLREEIKRANMIEKINQSPDSDANESYETIITEAYNKTHPLTGKRFRCDQFKIKAWIDPILKSIATKDKTYVAYRKSTRLSTKYFELKE